jgi:hypothetical protein
MSAIRNALELARGAQPVQQWTMLQALDNLLAKSIGYIVQLGPDRFEAQTLDRVALGNFQTRAAAALAVDKCAPNQGCGK